MKVVNQDRDLCVDVVKDDIHIVRHLYEGDEFYDFNLMYNKILLGTFDTLQEAFDECYNLINCRYEIYVISGFEDYLEY